MLDEPFVFHCDSKYINGHSMDPGNALLHFFLRILVLLGPVALDPDKKISMTYNYVI